MRIKMFNILGFFVLLCIFDNFEYGKASYRCVDLVECPKFYNTFKDPSQIDRDTEMVKKVICAKNGNLPKVWCLDEECPMPSGHSISGFCKPLDECAPVLKVINNATLLKSVTRKYVQSLKCIIDDEPYSVCCPSNEAEFMRRLFPPTNLLPDPNEYQCGAYIPGSKITKGTVTELHEFPWTVRLHYENEPDNTITWCAGSLINSRYIITAAHCANRYLERKHGKLDRVTLGEYNTERAEDCTGTYLSTCSDPPVIAKVESVTAHPDWYLPKNATIFGDIALIRLANPVNFTKYINPICLPEKNSVIPDNQDLTITGWGITELGNTSPIKLKAAVRVSKKTICNQIYGREKTLSIGDSAFCAKGVDGIDACGGDSGGPIMQEKINAKQVPIWSLAGIVSFGSTDCGKYLPGIYTYVSKYVDWIKQTIQP